MAEPDYGKVFGGGSGDAAASEGGSSGGDLASVAEGLAGGADAESADAPPPDFALNAAEAFPELAGDEARIDALYRTIKACHPV